MSAIEEILKQKILVCVGSGGVGKTTYSASLAVLAVKKGLNVLVMTIDPSKRLKTALGLTNPGAGITSVPVMGASGRLSAMMLDAQQSFHAFVVQSAGDKSGANRLLESRLFKQLSTTLSGSQEFTSFLEVLRAHEKNEYDLIILDTPPAEHAVDFLEAPKKIESLFQDKTLNWFLGASMDAGVFRRIFEIGTLKVFETLEKVTGSNFVVELREFFIGAKSVQHRILETTERVQKLLESRSTQFLLVTGFDEAKLKEAEYLADYLRTQSFGLAAIFVNRAFPKWFGEGDYGLETLNSENRKECERWIQFFKDRRRYFREFVEKQKWGIPIFLIPEMEADLDNLESLKGVAREIWTADSFG